MFWPADVVYSIVSEGSSGTFKLKLLLIFFDVLSLIESIGRLLLIVFALNF